MGGPLSAVVRVAATVGAILLLGTGAVLGYIAVVAARRSEGVFVPAGYVALACLACGVLLARVAIRH